MKQYAVVFEAPAFAGDNWSSYVPDLPGCISTGANLDECRQRSAESIGAYVEALRERGLPVPQPSAEVERVAAAA